ncbi:hypothetical protein NL676_006513 [Syzygium grande]|nr:hypothetical protein NL676_006513 [Syzygium grande]
MGCVSSNLRSHDDEFSPLGTTSALGHHIVSLTSTNYGLLTLDPPLPSAVAPTTPPTPPPRFTLGSIFPSPLSDPSPSGPNPGIYGLTRLGPRSSTPGSSWLA